MLNAPPATALSEPVADPKRPTRHSVSSVKTYERCPQQWWFKYAAKVKPRVGADPWHFRFGRVVHAGPEAAYLARKAGDPPAEGYPTETMEGYMPVAEAACERAWRENDMGEPAGGDWHEALRQVGTALSAVKAPPPAFVLGVEHKLALDTPGGTPMLGFVDLVESLAKETVLVRDWKSNSTPTAVEVLAGDLQLASYAGLVRRQWPWVKTVYVSHFHTPTGYENMVKVDDEAQEDAFARLDAVAELMEVDEPAPRRGAACTSCPFVSICPAWASDREAAADLDGF